MDERAHLRVDDSLVVSRRLCSKQNVANVWAKRECDIWDKMAE